MADQRLQYNEEMIGAGHPIKEDTWNRLLLVECDNDGKGKTRYLKVQSTPPSTDVDEGVLFTEAGGSGTGLRFRGESNGTVVNIIDGDSWA